MTINAINNILVKLAEQPSRDTILELSFALLDWMDVEPNSDKTIEGVIIRPRLISPQTQKLREFLALVPQTVQPQLYRLSAEQPAGKAVNQNIRIRFAVLKKIRKETISQLVDNDPGLTSYQASVKGLVNVPGRPPYIPQQPYFIHFVSTPAYDKLALVFNQGDLKRIVTFRKRLTNTQYHKFLEKWQGIASKPKPEIADLFWKSLDIKEVNKEFYRQIKEKFDSLLSFAITQNTGVGEEAIKQFAVRLIGRYIFCWFLKEKGIIPLKLLSSETIEYYHDSFFQIFLYKLFFKTLNSEVTDAGRTEILTPLDDLYRSIPYLNGGLFEFHREDVLFVKLDLNNWLISFVKVLEAFDFTVDESSSQYQMVAIDPEMLGRIFENLLASQNPDTEKMANQRKAFGAFYTPREIVDYMVNESLKAFLETRLLPLSPEETLSISEPAVAYTGLFKNLNPESMAQTDSKTGEAATLYKNERTKEKIAKLFAPDCSENPFDKEETILSRKSLSEITILDPACGSGAFPMGIMLRLMELRQIVGHGHRNSYDLKAEILSRNIFGVDIMPMAVEIARLRAWLSLVLESDYRPADRKNNFGIAALPNLDFKFICANSLIDSGYDDFLGKIKYNATLYRLDGEIQKLEAIRNHYFDPRGDKTRKTELQVEFLATKQHIKEHIDVGTLKKSYHLEDFFGKVDDWNPFDDSHPSSFFSPAWMFGITEGFDVVIGNPPYKILTKNNTDEKLLSAYINNFNSIKKGNSKNIFTLMIELGANVLNKVGCLTFIVPEGLFETRSYDECKQYLYANGNISLVVSFGHFVFENAITGNIIFQFNKQFEVKQRKYFFTPEFTLQTLEEKKDNVIDKIKAQKTRPLSEVATLFKGMAVRDRETSVGENMKFGNDIFLLGKSISNYEIHRHFYTKYFDLIIDGGTKKLSQYQIVPRILVRRTGNLLCSSYLDFFALTESTLYSVWSINPKFSNFYLLALLNSKLLTYYVQKSMLTNKQAYPQILMTDLELLPIKVVEDKEHKQIEKLVDEILSLKKQNLDSNALEKEIDVLVYKLYELNYDEVKIIDKDFWLSEEEYLNYDLK